MKNLLECVKSKGDNFLLLFYGISTVIVYLVLNPIYTYMYILYIKDL